MNLPNATNQQATESIKKALDHVDLPSFASYLGAALATAGTAWILKNAIASFVQVPAGFVEFGPTSFVAATIAGVGQTPYDSEAVIAETGAALATALYLTFKAKKTWTIKAKNVALTMLAIGGGRMVQSTRRVGTMAAQETLDRDYLYNEQSMQRQISVFEQTVRLAPYSPLYNTTPIVEQRRAAMKEMLDATKTSVYEPSFLGSVRATAVAGAGAFGHGQEASEIALSVGAGALNMGGFTAFSDSLFTAKEHRTEGIEGFVRDLRTGSRVLNKMADVTHVQGVQALLYKLGSQNPKRLAAALNTLKPDGALSLPDGYSMGHAELAKMQARLEKGAQALRLLKAYPVEHGLATMLLTAATYKMTLASTVLSMAIATPAAPIAVPTAAVVYGTAFLLGPQALLLRDVAAPLGNELVTQWDEQKIGSLMSLIELDQRIEQMIESGSSAEYFKFQLGPAGEFAVKALEALSPRAGNVLAIDDGREQLLQDVVSIYESSKQVGIEAIKILLQVLIAAE